MSTPPPHVQVYRYVVMAVVVLSVVSVLLVLPWTELLAAVDPWVDGWRRDRY